MLNRLILLIYHARCCLKRTGIRFIVDSLHPDVAVHSVNFLQIRYDFFPSQCRKWVWPSSSLSTLEWNTTASITAMSYSLSRCCQWWSMLQAIPLSFNKTTLHLIIQRTCTIKLLQQETLDFIGLISGHQTAQTWIPWTIKSGVLCSRQCMNVVWAEAAPCWYLEQSTAERYWRDHQRVEKTTESVHTCRWTTFWTFIVSACDWQKLWTNEI